MSTLFLFGSVARGKAAASSDVDVLVEFDRPIGLFAFVRLKRHLESILGTSVDLVTMDAIREEFANDIEQGKIHVA